MKYKYFISYVTGDGKFINCMAETDGKIESMDDIEALEKALDGEGVKILGYHELPNG